jgi:hypothetical protein
MTASSWNYVSGQISPIVVLGQMTDVLRRGMDMSWLTPLLSRGARALVVAITMLPVLMFVILSSPAWIFWPWLGEKRRESVHRMIDQLTQWTRDVLYQTAPLSAADPRQGRSAPNERAQPDELDASGKDNVIDDQHHTRS